MADAWRERLRYRLFGAIIKTCSGRKRTILIMKDVVKAVWSNVSLWCQVLLFSGSENSFCEFQSNCNISQKQLQMRLHVDYLNVVSEQFIIMKTSWKASRNAHNKPYVRFLTLYASKDLYSYDNDIWVLKINRIRYTIRDFCKCSEAYNQILLFKLFKLQARFSHVSYKCISWISRNQI